MNLTIDHDTFLNILVNVIIRQYFNDVYCFFAMTDGNDLNYFRNVSIPQVNIKTTDNDFEYDTLFNNFGCQGFVIHANSLDTALVDLEYNIRRNDERFNKRRYLLVSTKDATENSNALFNLPELAFIADVLMVVGSLQLPNPDKDLCKGTAYDLLTHKYVGTSNYSDAVLLDRWCSDNFSFLYNRDLYPDKISHQFGRELKMATFTYEPYSVVESGSKVVGSEMNLLMLYAKMHDMRPVIITDEYEWGEGYGNWTGNGILGNLVEDKADVGFGALYTWDYYYSYLDISKPLVRTGISFLVPAPRLLSSWSTPTRTYSTSLWIAFLVTYLAIVIALAITLKFYSYTKYAKSWKMSMVRITEKSVMTVGKLILAQPLTHSDQRYTQVATSLFLIIHLTCLIITSTYSSGLATTLTIPRYEASINTVDDFAARNLRWGATSDAWITSIEKSTEPVHINIVKKFVIADKNTLQNLTWTDNFAFSIERLPYDNFAIGSYIKRPIIGNYHLMEEDVYWEYCVMMMRKSSVLLESLDALILRVAQAGLLSHWQGEAVRFSMDSAIQGAVLHNLYKNTENVVALKIDHVSGALVFLVGGYCLSTLCLLVEILYRHIASTSAHDKKLVPSK